MYFSIYILHGTERPNRIGINRPSRSGAGRANKFQIDNYYNAQQRHNVSFPNVRRKNHNVQQQNSLFHGDHGNVTGQHAYNFNFQSEEFPPLLSEKKSESSMENASHQHASYLSRNWRPNTTFINEPNLNQSLKEIFNSINDLHVQNFHIKSKLQLMESKKHFTRDDQYPEEEAQNHMNLVEQGKRPFTVRQKLNHQEHFYNAKNSSSFPYAKNYQ